MNDYVAWVVRITPPGSSDDLANPWGMLGGKTPTRGLAMDLSFLVLPFSIALSLCLFHSPLPLQVEPWVTECANSLNADEESPAERNDGCHVVSCECIWGRAQAPVEEARRGRSTGVSDLFLSSME